MSATTQGAVHTPRPGTVSHRPAGRRHPLVALAMVLPLAVALALLFGGVDAVLTQASSVAGTLGR